MSRAAGSPTAARERTTRRVSTTRRVRTAAALVATAAAVTLALVALAHLHLALNLTPSMPRGLYRLRPVGGPIVRGEIVAICPTPPIARLARARGYLRPGACATGVEPLLKVVVAVAGDVVDVRDRRTRVDGVALPGSARLARDEVGRALPRIASGRYRLRAGELWVATPFARSWDSRYYGPLPATNVRALAERFVTIGGSVRVGVARPSANDRRP